MNKLALGTCNFGNVTLEHPVYSTGLTNNSSVVFCGVHLNF